MKTITQVSQWIEGAAEECGDPSIPICQLLVRYVNGEERTTPEKAFELFCFRNSIREPEEFTLWLGPDLVLPLFISRQGPVIENGQLGNFRRGRDHARGVGFAALA